MDIFKNLIAELDTWAGIDQPVAFWWRDDDAEEPSVALDKLMRVSDGHGVQCGLAAIPARAGEPLRKAVTDAGQLWVLQHGYAHVNHAKGSGRAWELGLDRPISVILDELRDGMGKFNQLFKERFVPVLVPPWNRMSPELMPYLPVMGYRGVSGLYRRQRPIPPGDLRVADCHCDVLHWKDKENGPCFAGAQKCVTLLTEHLCSKRTGAVDPDEPTCVLTHHLDMDDAAWEFVEQLFTITAAHPAATWMSPADIWPAT